MLIVCVQAEFQTSGSRGLSSITVRPKAGPTLQKASRFLYYISENMMSKKFSCFSIIY